MRVLGTKVLLRVKDDSESSNQSAGGIVLLAASTPNQQEAEVIAIGEEVKHAQIGTSVLIRKPAGVSIEHQGIKYYIINEAEILLVI